ncbi:hypothetical protein GGG16DRAFT_128408 [Schizophyllum commune]
MGWAVVVRAALRAAAAGASAVAAAMRSRRRRTMARIRGRGLEGRMGVNAARRGLPSSALSAPAHIPLIFSLYHRAPSRRRARCRRPYGLVVVLISYHLVPRQLHLSTVSFKTPAIWTPRPARDGPLHIELMQQM